MGELKRYEYPEGTREISGFGGDYEAACRAMVKAGCEWFDEHPDAEPKFGTFKQIYGITTDENDDAKSLTKTMLAAVADTPTGAMHQASLGHVFAIQKHGWDGYLEELKKADEADRQKKEE